MVTPLTVSMVVPPPRATMVSKESPFALSIAWRIEASVGSQWTSSKMARAIFSLSMMVLTLSTRPCSHRRRSVTSRTFRAPRALSSYPSSSVAPTPNLRRAIVKGMMDSSSTVKAHLLGCLYGQILLLHGLVAQEARHVVPIPDRAVVDDVHPVGHLHREFHVLLREKDGGSLLLC